jgi:hypothetical protein
MSGGQPARLLRACPFCGAAGKLHRHEMDKAKTIWWAQCSNTHCLARLLAQDNEEGAVSAWNKRRER